MFKNALTIPTGAGPAGNLFLLMIAKLTMNMPKSDAELVDVFVKFAKNNKVSYNSKRETGVAVSSGDRSCYQGRCGIK